MGAPDSPVRHRTGTIGCPVCRHVTQLLGFGAKSTVGALSPCNTGQSGALWLCGSNFSRCTIHFVSTFAADRCTQIAVARWLTGQSGGTSDGPVNYSGARLRKPESSCLHPIRSWCTGQSGAPDHSTLDSFCSFAPLNWIPNLNIYWFVLNLYAHVIHEYLAN
jgi:hypothetical protein